MQSEAFSAGSGDEVAFGRMIRGVTGDRKSSEAFPVKENVLCTEAVSSL